VSVKKVNGRINILLDAGSVTLEISNANVADAQRFLRSFCNALQSLEKAQLVQVKEPLQYVPEIKSDADRAEGE
jgi:hypothetical protein